MSPPSSVQCSLGIKIRLHFTFCKDLENIKISLSTTHNPQSMSKRHDPQRSSQVRGSGLVQQQPAESGRALQHRDLPGHERHRLHDGLSGTQQQVGLRLRHWVSSSFMSFYFSLFEHIQLYQPILTFLERNTYILKLKILNAISSNIYFNGKLLQFSIHYERNQIHVLPTQLIFQ